MRFVAAFVSKPLFRSFSSSPCIDFSHLTEENIGITSITINSLHFSNNLLSSLCSHIIECERNLSTHCILLNNNNTILTINSTDIDIEWARDSIREIEYRSIPIVTCFRDRVSSLLFEVAMSGDIRVLHESAWMEPMTKICLITTMTGGLRSLHKRDSRVDRRTHAYKLFKNNIYFGARDAIKYGMGDVCIAMHQDCYQAGLEICRGIVVRKSSQNPSFI